MEANKLNGTNYDEWLWNLRIVLDFENQGYVLDRPLPMALSEGSSLEEQVMIKKWLEDTARKGALEEGVPTAPLQPKYVCAGKMQKAKYGRDDLKARLHQWTLVVRSMMSFTELPPSFWGYTLETATKLLKFGRFKTVSEKPYEIWHGKPASYKYLRMRGGLAYSRLVGDKLDLRSSHHRLGSWQKGYTQRPGVDFEETYSPVTIAKSIRILFAIAAWYDYEIWQMDVKTTFLNIFVEEEIYIDQQEGFTSVGED
ncbi:Retrovirus-related Pol polyprotein from transposon RE2 [Sesamum angolense]|uniref:Retrovirus-related Pol polyprotein from transposon RE2 n=1 Tax=Sesamum angolense TaxID=2727404 RepID=A0AAE1VZI0_9LAMI|nr:Retrovirus-related Pol polyprotein from transposon RE2 [Sesamum angolense]